MGRDPSAVFGVGVVVEQNLGDLITTESAQRALHVDLIEQRLDRFFAFARAALVFVTRRARGNVGGIRQQHAGQIAGCVLRVDRTPKAALHQQRQAPGMIDVRMK